MPDVRDVRTATGPEPTAAGHYTTKNYVDNKVYSHSGLSGLSNDDHPQYYNQARGDARYVQVSNLQSESSDSQMYGDLASSARRDRGTNSGSLSNGYWTIASLVARRAATVTKIRFYVGTAGTAGASPTFTLGIYGGTDPTSMPRLATVPVVASSLTSVGVKEFTLSNSINLVAGSRYSFLSYIAPSSYSASPGLACTAVVYSGLLNPAAAQTFFSYKAAAATPGTPLNFADGTWTADNKKIWWALL